MRPLPPKERRIPDHHVRFRPVRFLSVRRQHRVATLDGLQVIEDRSAIQAEPVALHPLDLADPHRGAREFGGVGIDLDALDAGGADRRELAAQPQRVRVQLDFDAPGPSVRA